VPPFPRRVTTRWAGFAVVRVQEARESTGLSLAQLLSIPGVEQLTRIDDGREEQAVRIPVEVLEAASGDPAGFATVMASYGAEGTSDAEFRARIREIIDAPDARL
jgi:hypothetical protein